MYDSALLIEKLESGVALCIDDELNARVALRIGQREKRCLFPVLTDKHSLGGAGP